MNIFVTGATGFVGSYFVRLAIQRNHRVLALRRSVTSRARIALPREPEWICKGMEELSDADFVGVDTLVHLAAHTPNPPYDPLANCVFWNVCVPLNMFEQARQGGVRRYVVAGSCFEYGRSGIRYEFIPPNAPLEPTLSYPASKAASSIVFFQFAVSYNIRLSYHRVFHVYGDGEAEVRLWPSLRHAALTGIDLAMTLGEQVRDFVPVEDVATELLDACELTGVKDGEPLFRNLGSGRPQSIRKFALFWWRHWRAQGDLRFGAIPYREGEVMRYVPQLT